jgi:hypothetical protein
MMTMEDQPERADSITRLRTVFVSGGTTVLATLETPGPLGVEKEFARIYTKSSRPPGSCFDRVPKEVALFFF